MHLILLQPIHLFQRLRMTEKSMRSLTFQGSIIKQLFSKAFAISLIVILSFCQSCSTTPKGVSKEHLAEGWKIVKQDKGTNPPDWTIYSRQKAGSTFKEFKIIGNINVTPDKAIQALREKTQNSEKYIDEKEGYIKVLNSTENEMLVYSVYNMPFPFKDRAMCERFLFAENKETGVHSISWQEDWQAAPPQKKDIVRMPIARGSWEFVPIGSGRSRATYIVHADPGGSIPSWMVNATVSKGLPNELTSIEAIADSLKIISME